MGRNNTDFNLYYHASWKQHRESIERNGLKASQPWDTAIKGVYVGGGPHMGINYGDDVYEIKVPKSEALPEDDMEYGAKVIPRDVPVSDFKRVGHVFHHKGTPEIHLHPEEACDGKSVHG
jgi:hypothetical protein